MGKGEVLNLGYFQSLEITIAKALYETDPYCIIRASELGRKGLKITSRGVQGRLDGLIAGVGAGHHFQHLCTLTKYYFYVCMKVMSKT